MEIFFNEDALNYSFILSDTDSDSDYKPGGYIVLY